MRHSDESGTGCLRRGAVEVGDQRPGSVEQPGHGGAVVGAVRVHSEVAVDVLDGAPQYPQFVLQSGEAGSGDNDLALVEAALRGPQPGFVVPLSTTLAAVLPGPAGSVASDERSLAPLAAPPLCRAPPLCVFRHCDES